MAVLLVLDVKKDVGDIGGLVSGLISVASGRQRNIRAAVSAT
jgi:hypothetical protein